MFQLKTVSRVEQGTYCHNLSVQSKIIKYKLYCLILVIILSFEFQKSATKYCKFLRAISRHWLYCTCTMYSAVVSIIYIYYMVMLLCSNKIIKIDRISAYGIVRNAMGKSAINRNGSFLAARLSRLTFFFLFCCKYTFLKLIIKYYY